MSSKPFHFTVGDKGTPSAGRSGSSIPGEAGPQGFVGPRECYWLHVGLSGFPPRVCGKKSRGAGHGLGGEALFGTCVTFHSFQASHMMQMLNNCLRFKKSGQAKSPALHKEVGSHLSWIYNLDHDLFTV